MGNNINIEAIKDASLNLLEVWGSNKEFKLKEVTHETFKADVDMLSKTTAEISRLELSLVPLRRQREDLARKIKDINTRARSGMRGFFGPDSTQYEQVGGTRSSERKKGGHKPNGAEPAA